MSASKQQVIISGSPDSSEAIDSQHVTPATKLSAFSPDDTSASSSPGSRGMVRSKIPPPFELKSTSSNNHQQSQNDHSAVPVYHDPFVSASSFNTATTRSSVDPSKLSPAALDFTPRTVLDSPSIGGQYTTSSSSSFSKGITSTALAGTAGSGNLQGQLLTPHHPNAISPNRLLPKNLASNMGTASASKPSGSFSSEDETSRCLLIQLGPNASPGAVEKSYSVNTYPSLLTTLTSELTTRGVIYLRFADIRDADKAYYAARPGHVRHIRPSDFYPRQYPSGRGQLCLSEYEGQVTVTMSYFGRFPQFDGERLTAIAKEVLQQFGDIMAFRAATNDTGKVTLRVEFYDINAVEHLLSRKADVKVPMCAVSVERYEPDANKTHTPPTKQPGPIIIGEDNSALADGFGKMNLESIRDTGRFTTVQQTMYQTTPLSASFADRKGPVQHNTSLSMGGLNQGFSVPTSPYTAHWNPALNGYNMASPMWSPIGPGTIGQERGSPSAPNDHRAAFGQQHKPLSRTTSRQPMDFAAANHNVVDIERIRAGLDVRTTIMLRNIPNKIDQAMLKDIIDETSLGRYDFMYLRIDFANNCNVGYAFINFEDPIWIVDFVNARAGHRWNRYNSDKVAEVSYATIQGRDCLIQKFRNSSVMLEHPTFRPKLFHTGTGPLVGTEEQFPGPDNPSKMRRSVENAEHVGLFAPRAGQNFRDEQRRRRSQFDRGTRMSEAEDIYEPSGYGFRGQSHQCRPFPSFESTYQGYGAPYF